MQIIVDGPVSNEGTRGAAGAGAGAGNAGRRRRRASATRADVGPTQERSFAKRSPRPNSAPSEIAILDGEGRIIVVNQAWRAAAAAYRHEARHGGVGAAYAEVAPALLPNLDRATLERDLERLLSGDIDELRHRFAAQGPDGARWRHVLVTPLSIRGAGRFVAIHDDDHALSATTQEVLKVTSEQLLAARDEERQRIAIELHDSTSQHLTAIGLSLARLRRGQRDEKDAAILDEMRKSLDEAIKETRVLSYLIKPRGLGQDGLGATVLQFLEGFARRTGLEVALEADAAADGVPAPLQHAALRIVQEALLNANRHAEARRVSVELTVDDGLLKVSIVDDGHGMPSGEGAPPLGVGIPGMQARAQQFSGDLAISSDESGTRVVALLPLP